MAVNNYHGNSPSVLFYKSKRYFNPKGSLQIIITAQNFNKLQIITCQFPTHVDFQKIGEVSFKKEIYKVLKPQQHIVKESGDELRRENSFPKEGILIDTSGRLHYWKSLIDSSNKSEQKKYNNSENFQDQPIHNIEIDDVKNLNPEEKKSDNMFDTKFIDYIIQKALDAKDENKNIQNIKTIIVNDLKSKLESYKNKKHTNTFETERFDAETENNKNDTDQILEDQILEENTTLKDIDENNRNDETINEADDLNNENKIKEAEKPNENNDLRTEMENPNYETTTVVPEEDLTTTKRRKRKEKKEIISPNTVYIPRPLREGKGKTVVKTTFFCPFLGIITMSSLIDTD